jgi:hypothetical protein
MDTWIGFLIFGLRARDNYYARRGPGVNDKKVQCDAYLPLAALREALFPSRAAMACMYHAPANSWRILFYYPVRFKDLWKRYSRVMWQLLWHDRKLSAEVRSEAHLREYLVWN